MKYIGIDYGTKRTGVAVSDEEGRIAFPHKVLSTSRKISEEICGIAKKEQVTVFVLGHSVKGNREENSVMEHIHKLADALRVEGKVIYEDERYSSQHASRAQEENDMHDASTAAIILQSYLDRLNRKAVVSDPYTLPHA